MSAAVALFHPPGLGRSTAIAATAIATGGTVAPRDERSFRQIPGLSVAAW